MLEYTSSSHRTFGVVTHLGQALAPSPPFFSLTLPPPLSFSIPQLPSSPIRQGVYEFASRMGCDTKIGLTSSFAGLKMFLKG